MMSMDLRRAFGRWFLLAATVYCLLYINGVSYMIFEYDEYSDALMIFDFGSAMAFGAPLMPLIAALPFGTSFVGDFSAGFCAMAVPRCGKRRYLLSKALCTALSGGAAVAGGMFLFILTVNLLFPQDVSQPMMMSGASDLSVIIEAQGALPLLGYYLSRMFMQFMAGMWWATASLAFSAFYPNLPLTLCAPLLLYRIAGWVGQLPIFPGWMNITWLDDAQVGLTPPQVLLAGLGVFGALTIAAALLFCWRAGRRLSYA